MDSLLGKAILIALTVQYSFIYPGITDPEEKELYMCDILHQLPRCNLLTTLYLFEHLRK